MSQGTMSQETSISPFDGVASFAKASGKRSRWFYMLVYEVSVCLTCSSYIGVSYRAAAGALIDNHGLYFCARWTGDADASTAIGGRVPVRVRKGSAVEVARNGVRVLRERGYIIDFEA